MLKRNRRTTRTQQLNLDAIAIQFTQIKSKLVGPMIVIAMVYFLVTLTGFGYAFRSSEIATDIPWLLQLALVVTHLLPYIIIPVTLWVLSKRSAYLVQRGIHSLFLIQLGLSFLMISLSFEYSWHIQQGWLYHNSFNLLNYMFYLFMITGFALLANGFSRNLLVDILFLISLTTTSILYPVGAFFENSQFKFPIYFILTFIYILSNYRAYKILRDWRFIFCPFFAVGVNLFFIFLLNQYENDFILNPIFHSLHDIAGSEMGLVIFTYLIYINPSFNKDRIPHLKVPLYSQQSQSKPVLTGKFTTERFYVVIQPDTPLEGVLYLPAGTTQAPVVLFYGGGAANKGTIGGDRYSWLGKMLASNGFGAMFVLSTEKPTRLNWSQAMLERLSQDDLASRVDLDQVIIGGHSLGGLIVFCLLNLGACPLPHNLISAPSGLIGAFTLESFFTFPDRTGPVQLGNIPMMMIAGKEDGLCPPRKITQSFKRLSGSGPFYLVMLEGVNHYQMIDYLNPDTDLYKLDNTANVNHSVALERAGKAILNFLISVTNGSSTPMKNLAQEVGINIQIRT